MYTWGDNDEGQLGDGTTNAIQRPRLVAALQGKKINRVACGSAHTLAWSTSKPTNAGKLPAQVLHSLKVETVVKKIRFQLPVDGIKVVQIKIYLKKKMKARSNQMSVCCVSGSHGVQPPAGDPDHGPEEQAGAAASHLRAFLPVHTDV